jgi:GDPmannose 4,6-dehydratase
MSSYTRAPRRARPDPRFSASGALGTLPAVRALITGIGGQDGSYLAELLLDKEYEVHGLIRGSTTEQISRLRPVRERLTLHSGDLLDQRSLENVLRASEPDEIYHLAGTSFVAESWTHPVLTAEFTGVGAARMLEAMRQVTPDARFYQASSSEMFGKPEDIPQTEATPFRPRTPYGAAKCYAHFVAVNYRDGYGLFAASGILYNHESPRRPREFVTRKITHAAAAIRTGHASELVLGDLDAQRDWGYAKDYVEAMWLMLQQDEPDDFVIATGETRTVRDLVEIAFDHAGLDPWRYVRTDPRFLRPADVEHVVGDASKARTRLGWEPRTSFPELVRLMVDADLEALEGGEHSAPSV